MRESLKPGLKGKTIIIFGGCGLIGKRFAEDLLKSGAGIIIADRDARAGARIVARLGKSRRRQEVQFMEVDATSPESLAAFVGRLQAAEASLDGIVNCTYPRNKNYGARLEKITHADFCENVSLQLGAAFLLSQTFAEFFKSQGYGHVINLGSIYGVIAPRFEIYDGTDITMPFEYAATKSAIIHMTKYLAKYYRGCGVRFNCISPGGIKDGQPEKFQKAYRRHGLNQGLLHAEDLSGTLVFLLSEQSRAINGQNIVVDDGWTL